MSSVAITLLVIAGCIALGIVLAYVPMRLLLNHIANNVKQFIQRQREERRSVARDTPERRKEEPKPEPPKQVAREIPDRRKTSDARRQ